MLKVPQLYGSYISSIRKETSLGLTALKVQWMDLCFFNQGNTQSMTVWKVQWVDIYLLNQGSDACLI